MTKISNEPIRLSLEELNKHSPTGILFSCTDNKLHATLQESAITITLPYTNWQERLRMNLGNIIKLGNREFLPSTSNARDIADKALWHSPAYLTTGHWCKYTDINVRNITNWNTFTKPTTKHQESKPDQKTLDKSNEKARTLAETALAYAFAGALMARIQQMLNNVASLPMDTQARITELYKNHGTQSGVTDIQLLTAPKTPAQNRAIIKALKELQQNTK